MVNEIFKFGAVRASAYVTVPDPYKIKILS